MADHPVARTYHPDQNPEEQAIPGAPLRDIELGEWAAWPVHLRRSVDAQPFYHIPDGGPPQETVPAEGEPPAEETREVSVATDSAASAALAAGLAQGIHAGMPAIPAAPTAAAPSDQPTRRLTEADLADAAAPAAHPTTPTAEEG